MNVLPVAENQCGDQGSNNGYGGWSVAYWLPNPSSFRKILTEFCSECGLVLKRAGLRIRPKN